MKPAPFGYHAPSTLGEAVTLLGELGEEAKVLAGGQSLLPLMAMRLARPAHLVDVTRVAELGAVTSDAGQVTIGATVRQRVAERDPTVAATCPLIAEVIPYIGHAAIRSQGTVGGSLAHADPAAELPVAVVALGAVLVIARDGGRREVTADVFFDMPFTTALGADELLVAVRVPARQPRTGCAFAEVARRHGDFPLASAAACVSVDADGVVKAATLAFGGVAGTPVAWPDATVLLAGHPAASDTWRAAATDAVRGLAPRDDVHATGAYRVHVAEVLARRVLASAAQQAERAA